jgi:hypothetical protein
MRGEIILQCPFCAEKDAEIARLSKRITELCDALESCCLELSWDALPEIEKQRLSLLQRAREATK